AGIAWIRIGVANRTRDADDSLLLPGVVVENPIAFPDRPQVFLRQRIPDAGPHGLPIRFELIVRVVFRFFFHEPLPHEGNYRGEATAATGPHPSWCRAVVRRDQSGNPFSDDRASLRGFLEQVLEAALRIGSCSG